MTSLIPDPSLFARRRPYWLLLVLSLWVAGQCLGFGHWHAADNNNADFNCALCVLSSAGAAMPSSGWLGFSPQAATFFFLLVVPILLRGTRRFHDSRAPPSAPESQR